MAQGSPELRATTSEAQQFVTHAGSGLVWLVWGSMGCNVCFSCLTTSFMLFLMRHHRPLWF